MESMAIREIKRINRHLNRICRFCMDDFGRCQVKVHGKINEYNARILVLTRFLK